MRIMICGSMAFAKDMDRVQKELQALGHDARVPYDIDIHLKNEKFVDDLANNIDHARETDIIRRCFELVAECAGILVLNLHRKGIDGYIGTSALMEIGIAHFLKKKIFLYNPIPHFDDVRWAHEITIIDPVIINGDLNRIT